MIEWDNQTMALYISSLFGILGSFWILQEKRLPNNVFKKLLHTLAKIDVLIAVTLALYGYLISTFTFMQEEPVVKVTISVFLCLGYLYYLVGFCIAFVPVYIILFNGTVRTLNKLPLISLCVVGTFTWTAIVSVGLSNMDYTRIILGIIFLFSMFSSMCFCFAICWKELMADKIKRRNAQKVGNFEEKEFYSKQASVKMTRFTGSFALVQLLLIIPALSYGILTFVYMFILPSAANNVKLAIDVCLTIILVTYSASGFFHALAVHFSLYYKYKKKKRRAVETPIVKGRVQQNRLEVASFTARDLPHRPDMIYAAINILRTMLIYSLARLVVKVFEYISDFTSDCCELKSKLRKSKTYIEWTKYAIELDKMLELDDWKTSNTRETIFDEPLLIKITNRMHRFQLSGATGQLCDILEYSSCKNDMAGVEHEALYSRCYFGTKETVNEYVHQVLDSLQYIDKCNNLSTDQKAVFFKRLTIAYGRTALCLSGGATLGYFHLGVLKSLWEQNLLPDIISGTSAGAMMAAMVCCRTDDELKQDIFVPELANRINCCKLGIYERTRNFFTHGTLFTAEHFREAARWFCKEDMTFLEAYKLTGKILNITVMSNEPHSKLKLLNYINTPNVTLVSATVASSAVPGVLPPCELYRKTPDGKIVPFRDDGKLWRDGSMKSDIPEKELQQQFRVRHIIVSQVNPHVFLFFFHAKGSAGAPPSHRDGKGWRGGYIASTIVKYHKLELQKWITFIRDADLFPNFFGADFSNLWVQGFEGNTTITLDTPSLMNLGNLIYDPDVEMLRDYLRRGESQTWPKLVMIGNRLAIENGIVHLLKKYNPQKDVVVDSLESLLV
ncbi:hypothetical protein HDV01_005956 [Terramyces sp. JEL0728]|nr:hypothetical protein HDV01_005956 [Terramyces sp. JEL0728]